MNTPTF